MQTLIGNRPKSSPWYWGIWAPAPLLQAPASLFGGAFLQWPHFHTCQSLQHQQQVTSESHTCLVQPSTLHLLTGAARPLMPPTRDTPTSDPGQRGYQLERGRLHKRQEVSTKLSSPPLPRTPAHPSEVSLTHLSCISPQGAPRYTRELHHPWHTRSSLYSTNTHIDRRQCVERHITGQCIRTILLIEAETTNMRRHFLMMQ